MKSVRIEFDLFKTADEARGGENCPKFAEVQSNTLKAMNVTKQLQSQYNKINPST